MTIKIMEKLAKLKCSTTKKSLRKFPIMISKRYLVLSLDFLRGKYRVHKVWYFSANCLRPV